MSEVSVDIVGAGVAGLCVASEIAERGGAVRVHDLETRPGRHACSWWAGGMLAPDCEGESADDRVVRLGRQAADWWRAKIGGVTDGGTLVLALGRDGGELRRFARLTTGHETIDGERITELEPHLAGRFRQGLWFRGESHLDPRWALNRLVEHLAGQGIDILDTPPCGSGLRIDCTGIAAQGELTDLRGVRGEMAILRAPEIELSRPVRLLHPRYPIYVVPRGNGHYMLGATMIESEDRSPPTVRSILELLSTAYAFHPAFGDAQIVEIGADARPAFPDNAPRIRRRGNRMFVNGLFRHGFLLAPAVAGMVADYLFHNVKPELMDDHIP